MTTRKFKITCVSHHVFLSDSIGLDFEEGRFPLPSKEWKLTSGLYNLLPGARFLLEIPLSPTLVLIPHLNPAHGAKVIQNENLFSIVCLNPLREGSSWIFRIDAALLSKAVWPGFGWRPSVSPASLSSFLCLLCFWYASMSLHLLIFWEGPLLPVHTHPSFLHYPIVLCQVTCPPRPSLSVMSS